MNFYNFIPDFIKVDIEGAESIALQGGTKLASKAVTRFLIEMHSLEELPMKKNAELVIAWCRDNNNTAWHLKEERILDNPEIIAHRGRWHLLLQPSGWEYPEFLTGIKQGTLVPVNV